MATLRNEYTKILQDFFYDDVIKRDGLIFMIKQTIKI